MRFDSGAAHCRRAKNAGAVSGPHAPPRPAFILFNAPPPLRDPRQPPKDSNQIAVRRRIRGQAPRAKPLALLRFLTPPAMDTPRKVG
jgi:hypothetical protein